MAHKYIIDLTADEQEGLLNLINKGKPTARRVARAHVLLRADEGASDEEIAESLVSETLKSASHTPAFCRGLTAALNEQPRAGRRRSLTGKQEAFIVALACSTPPRDRRRWTMQLLAERLIELKQVEEISHDTVRRVLKKTISSRGSINAGVFPL